MAVNIAFPSHIARRARERWESEGKVLPQYVYATRIVIEENVLEGLKFPRAGKDIFKEVFRL